MLTEKQIFILNNFPTQSEYFKTLLSMFKNIFHGRHRYEDMNFSEKFKTDMDLRFYYYLDVYLIIDKYWNDIKDVISLFKLSKDIEHPGELFALIMQDLAQSANELEKLNLNNRTYRDLYDAYYEYKKCLNGADSKKLMKLIKKLKKKLKSNSENDLILQLILNTIPGDTSKKLKNEREFQMIDSTLRNIRNNRSKF